VATSRLQHIPFPAQGRESLTITSEEISRYAELTSLLTQLEAEKETFRARLLELRAAGAEQGTDSPYLLNFVDQDRRTVDWKAQALTLAGKLYGVDGAAAWKSGVEQSTPAQTITQIRVKPNPEYAAGLKGPAVPPRIPPAPAVTAGATAFGD
jgi:hypothetical protein